MSNLYIFSGLCASGKSSFAETCGSGKVTVSTDDIREKVFGDRQRQDKNDAVFNYAYARIRENLSWGNDVIFDATNLLSKRRGAIVNMFRKNADKIIAIFFATPYEVCVERNRKRDHPVPDNVVENMYRKATPPTRDEGFDDIIYIGENSQTKTFDEIFSLVKEICSDMQHDCPYHKESVYDHIQNVYNNVSNYCGEYSSELKFAAILHDVGKPLVKEYNQEKGYHTFYGHENIGAYLAACYIDFIEADPSLVAKLIKYHMLGHFNYNLAKTKFNPEELVIFDMLLKADKDGAEHE